MIKRHGRWKSTAMLERYIEDDAGWDDNATNRPRALKGRVHSMAHGGDEQHYYVPLVLNAAARQTFNATNDQQVRSARIRESTYSRKLANKHHGWSCALSAA